MEKQIQDLKFGTRVEISDRYSGIYIDHMNLKYNDPQPKNPFVAGRCYILLDRPNDSFSWAPYYMLYPNSIVYVLNYIETINKEYICPKCGEEGKWKGMIMICNECGNTWYYKEE